MPEAKVREVQQHRSRKDLWGAGEVGLGQGVWEQLDVNKEQTFFYCCRILIMITLLWIFENKPISRGSIMQICLII